MEHTLQFTSDEAEQYIEILNLVVQTGLSYTIGRNEDYYTITFTGGY